MAGASAPAGEYRTSQRAGAISLAPYGIGQGAAVERHRLVSAAGRAGFEVATPESVATATAQGQQVVVQDAFTTHYGSVQAIGFSAY